MVHCNHMEDQAELCHTLYSASYLSWFSTEPGLQHTTPRFSSKPTVMDIFGFPTPLITQGRGLYHINVIWDSRITLIRVKRLSNASDDWFGSLSATAADSL